GLETDVPLGRLQSGRLPGQLAVAPERQLIALHYSLGEQKSPTTPWWSIVACSRSPECSSGRGWHGTGLGIFAASRSPPSPSPDSRQANRATPLCRPVDRRRPHLAGGS